MRGQVAAVQVPVALLYRTVPCRTVPYCVCINLLHECSLSQVHAYSGPALPPLLIGPSVGGGLSVRLFTPVRPSVRPSVCPSTTLRPETSVSHQHALLPLRHFSSSCVSILAFFLFRNPIYEQFRVTVLQLKCRYKNLKPLF